MNTIASNRLYDDVPIWLRISDSNAVPSDEVKRNDERYKHVVAEGNGEKIIYLSMTDAANTLGVHVNTIYSNIDTCRPVKGYVLSRVYRGY